MSFSVPIKHLVILMPVYNDWQSFFLLVQRVVAELQGKSLQVSIYAINDGSTQPVEREKKRVSDDTYQLPSMTIIHLARNVGHQRAIALGLAYLNGERERLNFDAVIVMDSDGEDKPDDILSLINASEQNPQTIIFAQRAKRSESLRFRFFYIIYKNLYRFLTGTQISFGNFSLIPSTMLPRLAFGAELWTNYPAGVIKSRLPLLAIPTVRGKRLAGESRMNFVSLILHGLSGIAVHIDVVAVRLLLVSIAMICCSIGGIAVVIAVRLFSDVAIPGWATSAVGNLITIFIEALLMSVLLVFLVLNNKTQQHFIPALHFQHYIERIEILE